MFSIRRYAIFSGIALLTLLLLNRLLTNDRDAFGRNSRTRIAHGAFQWRDVPVTFPVKNLTPLPSEAPQKLARVQHTFSAETSAYGARRRERQNAVRAAFQRCWESYRKKAWMRDELAPLSGSYHDHFGGWAATLVDNLDTLWIMDMKEEFQEAVAAAVEIDLSRVPSGDKVNVFETTIRHLGGLLAAYDLSGDDRLLAKAVDFGNMLIVAFDTPNRMPITRWDPRKALRQPQKADEQVLVAEVGSLCMEFTRLSQLTGDPKWYDATERVTQVFARQQDKTHLPGMWPILINPRAMDFTQDTMFTLNAMADSLYEYFPKMHALLGGVEAVYRKMYELSTATAVRHTLWRPMAPGDPDILFSGNVRASSLRGLSLDPQGQHLGCFAGGMFALGGKLFGDAAHVEIGRKLTNGCIWAYDSSALGIMPEVFRMAPCANRQKCQWNETSWRDEIQNVMGPSTNVDDAIESYRLRKGYTQILDSRYVLRPEAIESVFILYRITGEQEFQEAAWRMFTSVVNSTKCELANAALSDVTYTREQLADETMADGIQVDSMESFWMAETLKYFYLIFSEPDLINLDEFVLYVLPWWRSGDLY